MFGVNPSNFCMCMIPNCSHDWSWAFTLPLFTLLFPDSSRTESDYYESYTGSDRFDYYESSIGSDRLFCPNNCGRSYKRKKYLSRHLKYECGVPKSFICIICGRPFARRFTMREHLRKLHPTSSLWERNETHWCIIIYNLSMEMNLNCSIMCILLRYFLILDEAFFLGTFLKS